MKVKITKEIPTPAAVAGRTTAIIRTLYRIDGGILHQYPPTPVTTPSGSRNPSAAEQFRKAEEKNHPDAEFFEVEIEF